MDNTSPVSPINTVTPTIPVPISLMWVYAVVGLVMMLLGVVAILSVIVLRPTNDNTSLFVMIVGFTSTTSASLLGFLKSASNSGAIKATDVTLQEVHLAINSRFDKFTEEVKAIAFEAGKQQAKEERLILDQTVAQAIASAPVVEAVPVEVVNLDPVKVQEVGSVDKT